jgi:thiol-disulfide isomerase/thioredoxin
MIRRVAGLSAVLALGLLCGRASADLGIGDPAPKLEVKEFVKGEAVKGFDKDKVYVVEFWATWCGPCRTSIPHLTELQKKYKDKVVVIGVSVWERDQAKVKPFVEDMGEKMDYRVALDDVGEGKGNDGKMARNWMEAAGQDGIPAAFIVNGEGKIAWIGHPMEMDKPLEQVVAGKWDVAKAAAEFKAAKAREGKLRELFGKLQKAERGNDPKAVVALIDEAVKEDEGMEKMLGVTKLRALIKIGDADKTREYGAKLADGLFKDEAQPLNAIAWYIVEKPGENPDAKLMKFALGVAERADKLAGGKDGAIADTLAKAYYETGDAARALEHQERAMKLVKGTPLEQDPEMKERLDLYKKKAGKE